MCDSKSPSVSRILLRRSQQCYNFNNDLKNAIISMVSTRLLIFKSSCLFNNPVLTVPSAVITIIIPVPFLLHSLFVFLPPRYLSLFLLSFNFKLWSAGTANSTFWHVLFFVDYRLVCSSVQDWVICLHFKILERILGCAYTIWSYGHIETSCTIPYGSPCPPSRV